MGNERIVAVEAMACSVEGCRMGPVVAAHVDPSGDPSGNASRSDDTQTVPLCEEHAHELATTSDLAFNRTHCTDLDMAALVISCRVARTPAYRVAP